MSSDTILSDLAALRPKSAELWERARRVIPSGTVSRQRITQPFPFLVERGEGPHLYDVDGNAYIDCAMGFGCHILGHRHPVVVKAALNALNDGFIFGAPHPRESELAALLVSVIPSAQKVTFCNSGSEATLHAIRLARAVTGRPGVAKFEGGYHGWHDGVLGSVTYDPQASGPIEDPTFIGHSLGVPDESIVHSHVLPFNHPAAFEKLRKISGNTAVVLVEAVQGAAGAIPAKCEFLAELRELCTELGVLLLLDEAVTGLRLAPGGAEESFGLRPDLAIHSKVVGAGLPLGVIAGDNEVMMPLEAEAHSAGERQVFFGGTYNGNVPTTAVGIAVLSFLRDNPELYDTLNGNGQTIRTGLEALITSENYPAVVLGAGSMFHVRFVEREVTSIRDLQEENKQAFDMLPLYLARRGIFAKKTFGILSLAHTSRHIEQILDAYAVALREMRKDGLL